MKTDFVENIRGIIPKKEEKINVLTDKVILFLESLKLIDQDLFSNWYEQAWSKKKALEKKVVFEKEFIQKIIEKSWDKKFPDLGSSFTFWSGKDNDLEGTQINFTVCLISKNKYLNNIVNISLPISKELRIDKNDQKVENIIKIIKQIWEIKEVEIDIIENPMS